MRVEFGDCARTSRPFEIGPRPMPLAAVTGAADGPPIPRQALDYQPGEHNPLRAVAAELADCFDDGSYGALVVDLVHATSRATVATVHGGSERVRWCIEGIARTLTLDRDAQRCSIAYGAMPLDDAPGVDVTKDEVRWGGQSVIKIDDIVHADGPFWRIEDLEDAVGSYLDDMSSRQLVMRGPIIVRAAPDAPLVEVNLVLHSLEPYEVALATQAGTGWRLVEPRTLPAVPVPLGSGGGASELLPGQPQLALAEDAVRIGRAGEPTQDIPPRNAARLAQALRHLHARAPARTDLVVTAQSFARGALTYADLIAVIEAARAAGFTDWRPDSQPP